MPIRAEASVTVAQENDELETAVAELCPIDTGNAPSEPLNGMNCILYL